MKTINQSITIHNPSANDIWQSIVFMIHIFKFKMFNEERKTINHHNWNQVSATDIEKMSRHCPALKVLHLFFVTLQVLTSHISTNHSKQLLLHVGAYPHPLLAILELFMSNIYHLSPCSLLQGDDASERAREKLFPNLEGKLQLQSC